VTNTLYRSNKSVPDRVDRAWHAGYVAGTQAWKRVAFVELVLGAWLLFWRRQTPTMVKVCLFYGLLLAVLVALVVAPVFGIAIGGRAIVRRRRSRRPVMAEAVDPDAF
jgi:multisubunit Na+/H+ antiporter MnhG subunit